MARRPRWLEREEKFALLCSLIVIGALAVFLQQLKESQDQEVGRSILVEYEEFSGPAMRRRLLSDADRPRGRKKAQKTERLLTIAIGADTASVEQTEKAPPSPVHSGGDAKPQDSTAPRQSFVFRDHKSDIVLDSIFKTDTTTRQMLLRQHLQYSSSSYDTASALQLVRLSNVIHRFDNQSVTLEEAMQRNIRRYGHPNHPVRPQPPSAQVPLEGIFFGLLDYIF